jgi:HSP20 family molecular chaperone IbpA
MKKDDIKVDLHDGRLTVSGERKEEKTEEKDKKIH